MKRKSVGFSSERRQVLRNVGGITLIGISSALLPATVRASKVSKEAMLYQTHPRGREACANCVHFEPGPSPAALGACSVVEGSINPHGYCIAYAPRA